MKKSLLIIAALIVSSFASAQQVLKIENPEPTNREGWVGNTDVTNMAMMENTISVIAPRQIDPEINGKITSLKFYRQEYQEYNTTSFTLKIFENIDLKWYDENMNYYFYESCGNEVYSQDFTSTQQGWVTVELNTPYNIPNGEFWIGVKMNGEGMLVFGNEANSVLGQYYYLDEYEFEWYWKPSYFVVNWDEVLFSMGLAVFVEPGDPVSCNPVQNLQGIGWAEQLIGAVLTWDTPDAGSTGNLQGYNVYRDGTKINNELVTETGYADDYVVPFETYSYVVEAVYDDGCSSESDPIEVTVDQGVGVVENSNVQVKVFPNPSEGFVNVTAEGMKDITLIDMMGRIVSQKATSHPTEIIDVTNLPNGVYLLRVTTEKGVASVRVSTL